MVARVRERKGGNAAWHAQALRISSDVVQSLREMYWPRAMRITPGKVIRALNAAGVKFVLMGTYGVTGWRSEPRATQDVDVLVPKRDQRKALRTLREAFPKLLVKDTPVVTRFLDPATNRSVIDLMKPTQAVFQFVFRHTIPVGDTHRIPNLEMALASKFAAMVSPNREQAKKLIDAGDFVDMVTHNRQGIDLRKLKRLASKVYPDGGAEIGRLIEDIDAGRQIRF
jgi:hypothetical protein